MYRKDSGGMRREEEILTSNSSTPLREPYSKPSIGTTLTSIFSSMPLIRVLVRRDPEAEVSLIGSWISVDFN